MASLSLSLLGPPRLEIDGARINITRKKSMALLGYLAATGQPHSRDMLATLLWPEADQSRARAALRNAIYTLNKTALAPWLSSDGEIVELRAPSRPGGAGSTFEVDVDCFRSLVDLAVRHEHDNSDGCASCLKLLTDAVAYYRDEFMAGFTLPDAPAFDEWQFFERNSLRQTLSKALVDLIELLVSEGQHQTAIPYARRLVELDPIHEPSQRILMRLFAQAGQQRAALRQYEVARTVLKRELGVEPAPETEALHQQIVSGTLTTAATGRATNGVDRLEVATVTDRKEPGLPSNLPGFANPFVGRERELARLTAFLEDESTGLTTLVGPGGIGKTRLALATAAQQLDNDRFTDGVFVVPLAPLTDPATVVSTIADTIGYPLQTDERTGHQQLVDFLESKSMLLVLDNFEHLLLDGWNPAVELVDAILKQSPRVKILATSRERLNLYGEQQFSLGGLEIGDDGNGEPEGAYPAAELFLESARRLRPEFQLESTDHSTMATICRLVEGMPLALELAATWLDALSLEQIASEINDNLDFLVTDVRNVPARHRSMLAVFETSWHALDVDEQATFAKLSVFRGGFTGDAAHEICDASPMVLRRLVRKSLLRFDPDERRYDLHELLRQYAADKLTDQADKTKDSHARYYMVLSGQQEAALKGGQQREALDLIGRESENIRAAFLWSADRGQTHLVAEGLLSLGLFLEWRGQMEEGAALFQQAFDALSAPLMKADGELRPQPKTPKTRQLAETAMAILSRHAFFSLALHRAETAENALERAGKLRKAYELAENGDPSTNAYFLMTQSDVAMRNAFSGEAVRLAEEALAAFKAADDDWGVAFALDRLSNREMNLGKHENAINRLHEALAIREGLNDQRGVARTFNVLGLVVLHIGEIEQSERYLRQSLELFRELGNEADLSNPLAVLGINLLFGGKFSECIDAYNECWTIHRRLNLPRQPFLADTTNLRVSIELGRYDQVAVEGERDLARYRSRNDSWTIAFILHCLGRVDIVRGNVERAAARFEESAGILHQMNERSLLPDLLFGLALTYRAKGDRDQAVKQLVEGLRLVLETGPLSPMRFELPAMALILADDGEDERAIEFYAAAQQSNYIANSRWFDDIAGRRIEQIKEGLPARAVAAAEARGRERDLLETARELLDELSASASV